MQIQKLWVIYDRVVKRAFVDVARDGVPAESLKDAFAAERQFSLPADQSRLVLGPIGGGADFDKAITNETRIISIFYARGRARKLLSSEITTVAE